LPSVSQSMSVLSRATSVPKSMWKSDKNPWTGTPLEINISNKFTELKKLAYYFLFYPFQQILYMKNADFAHVHGCIRLWKLNLCRPDGFKRKKNGSYPYKYDRLAFF
jgi:hypothetical protein